MASSVLEIFVKILSNYEPLPEHLQDLDVEIQGVRFGKAAKPPGYELMIHLLNDTPMFRLVCYFVWYIISSINCHIALSGLTFIERFLHKYC